MADLTDFDTPPIVLMEDSGSILLEDWQTGWYLVYTEAGGNYSRGAYADLPAGELDLTTVYDATDLTTVELDDADRVAQSSTGGFTIHQFKDDITDFVSVDISCNCQTNIPCATSEVFLQVYNYDTEAWETLTSNTTAEADTDFTLTASIP